MRTLGHPLLVAASLVIPAALPVDAANDPGIAFFEKEIRPLLVKHCYECHSRDAEKLRGGLHLDSQPGWQEGGDTGPAIAPGEPGESLLVQAIRYTDAELEMPPKQQLPPEAIETLEKWVAMGAPDPRKESTADPADDEKIDLEEGREFWSFRPIRQPEPPSVEDGDWPRNPIDRFILARLEEEGHRPAPAATPHTLARRLHLDLAGLPPTPEAVDDFVTGHRDAPDETYESLVDRLLASKSFGRRWGRHWLDLARYADSSGGGASEVFPHAWKYRDYVVRSFNEDAPFDRFAAQQLAGDLLPADAADERFDNLVATGFLALGPRNYINDDAVAFRMDGADEQLDTVGRVFMGMTLGCARCHDHKFDPVPMRDYYAMAGIFTSTRTSDPIPATTNFTWNEVADPRADPDGSRLRAYEEAHGRWRRLRKRYAKTRKQLEPEAQEALKAKRDRAKEAIPEKPPVVMGVTDVADPGAENRRIRGNPHRSADPVPRGFLRVTFPQDASAPAIPEDESGRRQLAEWITSRDNPLTARVWVNRVWGHLMGRGLVSTPDNFGTTGKAPSHPELLDWLAAWFLDHGQSTKDLVELIVSSRAYRLGPAPADSSLPEADPANELCGRRTRRALDAETLRNSILRVSGSLDRNAGSGAPFPDSLKDEFAHSFSDDTRRSIYLARFRNNFPELLDTFDAANPATVVGKRDRTISSPQALYLLHHPFVRRESKAAARDLLALDLPLEDTVRRAFVETLGRPPNDEEARLAAEFLRDASAEGGKAGTTGKAGKKAELERWTAFQQNLFASVDFRFAR